MTAGGYSGARQKGETVARILRDIACLIGEPAGEQVTLETGGEIVPGLGLQEDAAALGTRARDLSQGLFTILVLGEFKNGKSTLLNGMLGSKTLPAKAAPATAIISVLVHGESDRVAIYETDRLEPRLVSWEEFVGEFQLSLQDQETLLEGGTLDRFRHVRYALVENRHPLCANGVRLVDSPGLGEHISRTRVTTNYLKQAHAVIFVLNATRILGQAEREFIQNTLFQAGSAGNSRLGARVGHIFFVVNRMDQVDQASTGEIRAWVESGLAPYFADERGGLDRALYDRRVFFVAAKQALDARIVSPIDEAALAASGVPELEAELERFLTSEEKVLAALQSTVQTVAPIVRQARRRVEQQKAALDQPLAELERRHAQAEEQLAALQGRKDEIERTILRFGDVMRQKVYMDLRAFVDEMHESWAQDSHQLVDLDAAVSLKNLLTSYARAEAKERMAAAIGEQVQRYLQIKFGQWLDRVPVALQRDVGTMVAEVEAQVDDFQLELDQIATAFSGAGPLSRSGRYPQSAGLMDLALTLDDISGMTDTIMHPSDWTDVVGRMAQQAVTVFLVGSFLTGGNFLLALVAVEVVHLGLHDHEVKKRIRESLGERLHAGLVEQLEEKRWFVHEAVEQRFRQFARAMTEAIRRQIEEVRTEQERILTQKRDERFSVEHEKRRLDAIDERLVHLYGDLTEAAYGTRGEA